MPVVATKALRHYCMGCCDKQQQSCAVHNNGGSMKNTLAAMALICMGMTTVCAGTQQEKMKSCNDEASSQSLAGDARKAFMKNCLSADPMSAQQLKMKTCNADASAKSLAGDERKAFMKSCLSAKATPPTQQDKMKTCNADASAKSLTGDARKAFMKSCLSASPQ
jgi:hypothetical protein